MDNKHKMLTSLRIRGMQIKSTMRCLFNMLAKNLIHDITAVEAVRRTRYPVTAGRTIKCCGYEVERQGGEVSQR